MHVRYYIDPGTSEPHMYRHEVTEAEVEQVLNRPMEDWRGADDARVALGQTRSGRYLRVVYVPDVGADSVFVITAYDLGAKATKALRRRRKRKQS